MTLPPYATAMATATRQSLMRRQALRPGGSICAPSSPLTRIARGEGSRPSRGSASIKTAAPPRRRTPPRVLPHPPPICPRSYVQQEALVNDHPSFRTLDGVNAIWAISGPAGEDPRWLMSRVEHEG